MENLKLIMSQAFFINANMSCVRRAGTLLSADQLILPIFKVTDGITLPPLYNVVFSPTYLHAICINFFEHISFSPIVMRSWGAEHTACILVPRASILLVSGGLEWEREWHCLQPSHWWKKLLGQDPGLYKLLWRAASTTVEACRQRKLEKEIRFKNKLCNTNITATNCFDLQLNLLKTYKKILVVIYSYIEEDCPLMRR